jgi:hypothetical protein
MNLAPGFRGVNVFSALLAVSVILFAGCGKTEPKANPHEEFKAHVRTLQNNITNKLAEPVRYDIRKTDSIVSPLVGQIEYTEITQSTDNPSRGLIWQGWSHRFTLAYQSSQWVLTKVEWKLDGSSVGLGSHSDWHDSSASETDKKMLGIHF